MRLGQNDMKGWTPRRIRRNPSCSRASSRGCRTIGPCVLMPCGIDTASRNKGYKFAVDRFVPGRHFIIGLGGADSVLMSDAERFRAHAERCRALASQADDPPERNRLLKIAIAWDKFAAQSPD